MDKNFIEEAYRKLKGSVYLDKTVPFLRTRIVEFENQKFEQKINFIYEAINDLNKWNELEKQILDSIRVFTFPKSLKIKNESVEEETPIVISNISADRVIVDKYNNFIDMCVEGHLIGILWILTIGYQMDKDLFKNCFGNRLCDNLMFSNEKTTASPNLFKPYFKQYENWRNKGLKKAQECVNLQNKSIIITMLDLTRYYYNVEITHELFDSISSQYFDSSDYVLQRINNCVYLVLEKYSAICGCTKYNMLPIGYLPSNIISNYYLKNLDNKMSRDKDTIYYGRYVDDIILVTEIENSSELSSNVANNGSEVISNFILEKLEGLSILGAPQNNEYTLVDYPNLKFQKDKFRFFYLDKEGYDTIIEKIQDDILKNVSEFNFIPEETVEELDKDVLKLDREDTVNKLRGIKKVAIDKYILSKLIGKNIMMSKFAEERAVDNFIKSIGQLLDYKEVISNYTLWENILNYYVVNDRYKEISEFSQRVLSAIDNMDENEGKEKEPFTFLKKDEIVSVGDSLICFYFSCFVRATSISWGSKMKQVLEELERIFSTRKRYPLFNNLFTIKNMIRLRKGYCNSRMMNKNLLPISIEECMLAFRPSDEGDDQKLFSLKQYLLSDQNISYSRKNRKYAPYIQSPFEILYSELIKQIRDSKEELHTDKYCVNLLCKRYSQNFGNHKRKYISSFLRISSDFGDNNYNIELKSFKKNKGSKLRIAVANVKMNERDIINILEDKRRDVSERCNELGKIINESIKYKADILVLPEAYIPLEYLNIMQSKVAKHNMVIIGGIEHIKQDKLVYNITTTILPLTDKKMSYAIPFFHQKVYFSPHELDVIKKYSCKPAMGLGHTLFKWSNIQFSTYCCYELTSINLRSKFQGYADIIFGVEWNKDTYYFGNIIEALSRDIYCYCVQANMSEYGDSRIVQPTKKDTMNILRVKGGINASVLIGEVDIKELRDHQKNIATKSSKTGFKPLPAGWDYGKVKYKK